MLERRHAMSNLRLHEIISSSLKKREKLQNRETSLIRLIDGQGDNLAGHILESYGKGWLISTSGSNLRSDVREILSSYGKPLYWKTLDQHQKESPIHLCGEELPEFFFGLENGLRCRLSFKSGYSQGIFIDQRNNREALRNMVKPGQTVLNTFAYTGFFSIAAAAAGAAIKGVLQLRDKFKQEDLVVVLFHDHGSRYLKKIYNDDWMREMGYM